VIFNKKGDLVPDAEEIEKAISSLDGKVTEMQEAFLFLYETVIDKNKTFHMVRICRLKLLYNGTR
jgi:hypothetical protein